jgi:short-subunit dehydrogenase
MVDQGFGHIVNTASLAGLVPAPLMLPYTATKHAVVGLSLALRAEAAAYGVRVSVVCPGFTDTPLLDHANPGLPATELATGARDLAVKATGRLYSVDALADDILRGVARNKPLIVAPASGRAAWRAARLSPSGAVRAAARAVRWIARPSGR